jgi:hypothetical protein
MAVCDVEDSDNHDSGFVKFLWSSGKTSAGARKS